MVQMDNRFSDTNIFVPLGVALELLYFQRMCGGAFKSNTRVVLWNL